jgi:hypothetical protein
LEVLGFGGRSMSTIEQTSPLAAAQAKNGARVLTTLAIV